MTCYQDTGGSATAIFAVTVAAKYAVAPLYSATGGFVCITIECAVANQATDCATVGTGYDLQTQAYVMELIFISVIFGQRITVLHDISSETRGANLYQIGVL